MNEYVDVFISHKKEDAVAAKRLRDRIRKLGHSCYVDATDRKLGTIKSARRLAQRLRAKLRRCRCLIFVYSKRSIESKWMPWELGFFDGRWGTRSVGLYFLDGPIGPPVKRSEARTASSRVFSIQEYLAMYERVNDANLAAFLRRNTSSTALLNRADVDVDRYMTLMSGAMRNPMDFYLGCIQYFLGVGREMATSLYGANGAAFFPQIEHMLGELRRGSAAGPAAAMFRSLPPALLDGAVERMRKAHMAGERVSAV